MLELVPGQLHNLQERHNRLFGSDEHSFLICLLPKHRVGLQSHPEGHIARHKHKHIVGERTGVLLCILLSCQFVNMLADASYMPVKGRGLFLFGRGVHIIDKCCERNLGIHN